MVEENRVEDPNEAAVGRLPQNREQRNRDYGSENY
jgi:hypothetical protein